MAYSLHHQEHKVKKTVKGSIECVLLMYSLYTEEN